MFTCTHRGGGFFMPPLRLLILFAALGLLLGAAGCSGQLTVGTFTSGAGGTGSTGTVSGSGSPVASGASTGAGAPACPIASAQSTLIWDVACYPQSALPSGACSGGAASCSFCSFAECADLPDQSHSPRTFYSCACDSGQWNCAVVNQDVGICPLSANVASDDAGGDASVSCDDGTGATNCCPANVAEGVACDSTIFTSACLRRCSFASPDASTGYRSSMQCVQGMWNPGMGLLPCERLEAGSGSSGSGSSSGSTPPVSPIAACDDYFAAQYDRGCGGPQLPPTEAARIRTRFEQVCQNQYALPGSGVTPPSLEACASAIEASPCGLPDGTPAECLFTGILTAGVPCNEGFQCQSGGCNGTVPLTTPEGPSGPTTCGRCTAPAITMLFGNGQIGDPCDGQMTPPCTRGLYCDTASHTCAPLEPAGTACGTNPPGGPSGCAPPLSCVGSAATAACSLGAQGASCLNDIDCAPGMGCRGPCLHGSVTSTDGGGCQPATGTCEPMAWAGPGQPCDLGNTTNCLVGSCGGGPFNAIKMPSDGGPLPGLCPLAIADGQPAPGSPGPMANTYATCDTFAQPFLADFHYMFGLPNGGAYGTCTLFDSVVCK
jgi:hypothetical protein